MFVVKVITKRDNTEDKQLQHKTLLWNLYVSSFSFMLLSSRFPCLPASSFFALFCFLFVFSSSLPSLVLPLCTTDKASCRLQSTGKVSNCNSFSGPFRLILTFVLLYFEAFLSTRQQKVAILCLLWLQLYWITLHHCFPPFFKTSSI